MQKSKEMLTREQILEIDQYCQEHKVSQQSRLDELGIGRHQYYVWKRKYRMEDEEGRAPGEFQLRPGGDFVSPMMPPAKTSGKEKKISNAFESYLTVEIRTSSGTAMRIQGSMTAAHLREIIAVK